jgi:hypothetical protein
LQKANFPDNLSGKVGFIELAIFSFVAKFVFCDFSRPKFMARNFTDKNFRLRSTEGRKQHQKNWRNTSKLAQAPNLRWAQYRKVVASHLFTAPKPFRLVVQALLGPIFIFR